MKILMINSVCGIGSTGRICTDLAVELEKQGHEVKIAYGRENILEQYKMFGVRIGNNLDNILHGTKARLLDADGLGSKSATIKFIKWVDEFDPDIIHLHNLHGYYINVPILFQYIIKKEKKVVWTLHDCWSFSGHSGTCDVAKCKKWLSGCGKCPLIKSYPKSYFDFSKRNFRWKKKLFNAVDNMILVTPSKWLAKSVSQSFLKGKDIEIIPNGIDKEQFRPTESDFRKTHNIEEKIVLLGCATSWGKEKGLDDFITLAEKLDSRFCVVLLGMKKNICENIPPNIICVEKTDSVEELNKIYSSADLFINLTYADVYSMVNREALLAETPVLTYNTGGCGECINDNNGMCFKTGDIDGVFNFLNSIYKKGMFNATILNKEDPISKEQAINKYSKIYSILNCLERK